MKLTCVLMVLGLALLSGCDDGGAPSDTAYGKKLEQLENSPTGRYIDKQKEIDRYRTLTDEQKTVEYNRISQ